MTRIRDKIKNDKVHAKPVCMPDSFWRGVKVFFAKDFGTLRLDLMLGEYA